MSVISPKFIEGALVGFASKDKANLLKLYHAACLETGCPTSDQLTQRIRGMVTNPYETPEVQQLSLAIVQTLALRGLTVNPFPEIPRLLPSQLG